MIEQRKDWENAWLEFRETGLFLFINSFLHIFGYVIVMEMEEGKVLRVYPAKTSFRGFSEENTEKAYNQIEKYMKSFGVEGK